jgi:hypothetical protein
MQTLNFTSDDAEMARENRKTQRTRLGHGRLGQRSKE